MSFSDPIGDLLTRIRNAQSTFKRNVTAPASNLKEGVLEVLLEEGYIRAFSRKNNDKNFSELHIELKYVEGQPVIREIQRVSKPGRRVYSGVEALPKVLNGLGISILSTPRGVISDAKAREINVGGEVLCTVY